jgi:hypothetical protein
MGGILREDRVRMREWWREDGEKTERRWKEDVVKML